MKPVAYLADKIFTANEWLTGKAIITKDGKIEAVANSNELPAGIETKHFREGFIAPAFIDLQIYGANKKLFSAHTTPEALSDLYAYCKEGGATLCLPTLATNSLDVFYKAIDVVKEYWKQGGKGILGLHLEGPWINKKKRGAHIEAFIHPPTITEIKNLLAHGQDVIKMITLAPEVCDGDIIRLILSKGIIVSAGHSDATYQQAVDSFNTGIPTITHLYNAMSPLQHRELGLVGAALHHSNVRASIIPDGYHVAYEAISIAKKIMGNRLYAITDAVTETTMGPYQHQLNGDRYVCGQTLSGSALTMYKAFYNLVNKAGIAVEEALRMCSLYPAEVAGISDTYGKIAPGFAAQFVVINKQLNLVEVIT